MANVLLRKLRNAGLLIVGGTVGITGMAVGGLSVPRVSDSGTVLTSTYVARDFAEVNVSATGGNVKVSNMAKYDSVCIENPLTKYSPSLGTGALTAIHFDMGNNPAGAVFDCGFRKACLNGTGSDVINSLSLGTGATKTISGSALPLWNGADFFDCGTLTNPTSGFNARIRLEYRDVYGE